MDRDDDIPQADLLPAFPVVLLNSWLPLPKSSVPPWMTIVRYMSLSLAYLRLSEKRDSDIKGGE